MIDRQSSTPQRGTLSMAREELLIDTLVTLADTLVDDYDVIDFVQTLAERCVELLDVSAAGIMLADGDGALRHAACSSEQMLLVELFEPPGRGRSVLRRVQRAVRGAVRFGRGGHRGGRCSLPGANKVDSSRCRRSRCDCAPR